MGKQSRGATWPAFQGAEEWLRPSEVPPNSFRRFLSRKGHCLSSDRAAGLRALPRLCRVAASARGSLYGGRRREGTVEAAGSVLPSGSQGDGDVHPLGHRGRASGGRSSEAAPQEGEAVLLSGPSAQSRRVLPPVRRCRGGREAAHLRMRSGPRATIPTWGRAQGSIAMVGGATGAPSTSPPRAASRTWRSTARLSCPRLFRG